MTRPPPLPVQSREPLSWLDQQLIDTRWPMLIAVMVLFFVLVFIFSIIGLIAARHPDARRKAKTLFAICACYGLVVGLFVFAVIRFDL